MFRNIRTKEIHTHHTHHIRTRNHTHEANASTVCVFFRFAVNRNVWNEQMIALKLRHRHTKFINIVYAHVRSYLTSQLPTGSSRSSNSLRKLFFFRLVFAVRNPKQLAERATHASRTAFIFGCRKANGFSIHESWTMDWQRTMHT